MPNQRLSGSGMNQIIEAKVITIGRSADIVIRDPSNKVSREHCELTIVGGGYYICDLNSQNGTYVEKEGGMAPIRRSWVKPEQKICMAKIINTTLTELLKNTEYAILEVEPPVVSSVKQETSYTRIVKKFKGLLQFFSRCCKLLETTNRLYKQFKTFRRQLRSLFRF